MFAKTFGTLTKKSISRDHPVGNFISKKERYLSSTKAEFNEGSFRRLPGNHAAQSDHQAYENYMRSTNNGGF
jgi:hypothetical protein